MNRVKVRSRRGAVLLEGVAAIWLIVTVSVVSISLLINSGMSMFYKQKIAFVAMETAIYTAGLKMNVDKVATGEEFAKQMLNGMGMSVQNAKIEIKETMVMDAPAISAQISLSKLPLLQGSGGMLPFSITLADKAVAIKHATPEAYVWLSNSSKMSPYLFPVVRVPPGGPNSVGLPVVVP